jgi:hypothetical protein
VIVTMTPLLVFSELDSQRRFLRPFLPAPRITRRDQGQADAPGHNIETVVTETIRTAAACLQERWMPSLERAWRTSGLSRSVQRHTR